MTFKTELEKEKLLFVQVPFSSSKDLVQSHLNSGKEIILFDGVCYLCNSTIRFIANNDNKNRFLFLHLQTDLAKEIMLEQGLNPVHFTSVLLLSKNNLTLQSTAILSICKRLSWPIPILFGFIIVPSIIRNAVYRFVAAKRYDWYGKSDACLVPNEKVKAKLILDQPIG